MQGPISQRLIGHRIKAARVAAERTQEDLTRALGLNDRQSVSDIENGKRALKPDEIFKTVTERLSQYDDGVNRAALQTIATEANDARFAAIGALIAEWQPARLVVGHIYQREDARALRRAMASRKRPGQ